MREMYRKYYAKYKKQIIPILLISLSFFVIFRVILPQVSAISESNQAISEKIREVETLKDTLSALSSLNEADSVSNLQTSLKALPTSKDISIIFSALSSAATSSQSELKDFSLKVGGVYGRAAKVSSGGVKGVPAVDVIARVSSPNPENLILFSKELRERLPLAEVKRIDSNNDLGTFEIGFYYKVNDLSLISRQDKVLPLSQADLNLITQLKGWDK